MNETAPQSAQMNPNQGQLFIENQGNLEANREAMDAVGLARTKFEEGSLEGGDLASVLETAHDHATDPKTGETDPAKERDLSAAAFNSVFGQEQASQPAAAPEQQLKWYQRIKPSNWARNNATNQLVEPATSFGHRAVDLLISSEGTVNAEGFLSLASMAAVVDKTGDDPIKRRNAMNEQINTFYKDQGLNALTLPADKREEMKLIKLSVGYLAGDQQENPIAGARAKVAIVEKENSDAELSANITSAKEKLEGASAVWKDLVYGKESGKDALQVFDAMRDLAKLEAGNSSDKEKRLLGEYETKILGDILGDKAPVEQQSGFLRRIADKLGMKRKEVAPTETRADRMKTLIDLAVAEKGISREDALRDALVVGMAVGRVDARLEKGMKAIQFGAFRRSMTESLASKHLSVDRKDAEGMKVARQSLSEAINYIRTGDKDILLSGGDKFLNTRTEETDSKTSLKDKLTLAPVIDLQSRLAGKNILKNENGEFRKRRIALAAASIVGIVAGAGLAYKYGIRGGGGGAREQVADSVGRKANNVDQIPTTTTGGDKQVLSDVLSGNGSGSTTRTVVETTPTPTGSTGNSVIDSLRVDGTGPSGTPAVNVGEAATLTREAVPTTNIDISKYQTTWDWAEETFGKGNGTNALNKLAQIAGENGHEVTPAGNRFLVDGVDGTKIINTIAQYKDQVKL